MSSSTLVQVREQLSSLNTQLTSQQLSPNDAWQTLLHLHQQLISVCDSADLSSQLPTCAPPEAPDGSISTETIGTEIDRIQGWIAMLEAFEKATS